MSADLGHLADAPIEALVIGGILQSGESAYREVAFLNVDDFTKESHRITFRAITDIAPEVHPRIDAVAHRLDETGKLEAVGGLTGLVDLDAAAIPGIRLEGFARTLRQKSIDRRTWRLNAALSKALESGFRANSPEVRAIAAEILALVSETGDSSRIIRIEDLPAVGAFSGAIEYIREPELPAGAVIGLTGDSGSGKSTLATAFVRDAIARGIAGLILDRESPRSIALDRMNRLEMIDGPLLRWWGGWNGGAPGPETVSVTEWVVSCNPKPIVVIDSVIAFIEGDENASTVMRKFTNSARRLADLGASVVLIAHDGKAETARDFRGSSDFKASVDQAFHVTNLSSDGKLDRLTLRCFKSRYGFSGSVIYHYGGGRFIRDERADAPARTAADELTELLRAHPGIKTKEFEDAATKKGLGRNRGRDFLSDGVLTGVIRREDAGRNQFRHYLPEDDK